VPSISSLFPSLTYLALPPPGAGAGTAGASLAADPQPVQPVPPVTRRTERADAQDQGNQTTGAGRDAAAGPGRSQTLQSDSAAGTAAGQGPVRSQPVSSSTSGFTAQQLSQENLGSGLHIEPWQTALSSYRSAAALPGSASQVHAARLTV